MCIQTCIHAEHRQTGRGRQTERQTNRGRQDGDRPTDRQRPTDGRTDIFAYMLHACMHTHVPAFHAFPRAWHVPGSVTGSTARAPGTQHSGAAKPEKRNPTFALFQALLFCLQYVLRYLWRANTTELPGWKWQPRDADRFGLDFHLCLSCDFPPAEQRRAEAAPRPWGRRGPFAWPTRQSGWAPKLPGILLLGFRETVIDGGRNRFMSWEKF